MKNIIAFAGSNSRKSRNKQLATYASSLIDHARISVLDLNDFELPIFGVDLEREEGIPRNAYAFLNAIKSSDGIIVSLAENNGSYAVVFKNLLDWMSRIEGKTFYSKPMLLMATSTGKRGGQSVLEIAKSRFPRHDAKIVADFSLPLFNDNFYDGKITDENLDQELKEKVIQFSNAI